METLKEVKGTYGSLLTPCTVLVYDGWYCVEGSCNVNQAADPEALTDEHHRLNVEEVEDVDCFTASAPINSMEELEAFIND